MKFQSALIMLVALSGCASAPNPVEQRNSALTHGNVQLNLSVGKTTQAEVLEKFGSPNITTMDGARNEIWSYQRHATVSQSAGSASAWSIVLFGGGQYAEGFQQSQRTITLIIKFDANHVVSDFRSRSSDF